MFDLIQTFELGMDRSVSGFRPFASKVTAVNLNVGAGAKQFRGFIPMDADMGWFAPILPFADGTVDNIVCFHFLEHLTGDMARDQLFEFQRVLRKGGLVNIVVPHWDSEGAHQDLDHKSTWSESSFKNLFQNPYYHGTSPRHWEFKINASLIMGVAQRNLAVVAQLERV